MKMFFFRFSTPHHKTIETSYAIFTNKNQVLHFQQRNDVNVNKFNWLQLLDDLMNDHLELNLCKTLSLSTQNIRCLSYCICVVYILYVLFSFMK